MDRWLNGTERMKLHEATNGKNKIRSSSSRGANRYLRQAIVGGCTGLGLQ